VLAETLDIAARAVIVAGPPVWWLAETLRPLSTVTPKGQRLAHLRRNGVLIALGVVVNGAAGALFAWLVPFARSHHTGLLAALALPLPLDIAATVLAYDLVDYWRHRLHHAWRPLWRLHQVHHLDEAVDVSTGYLNHPLEVVPMALAFAALTLLLAPSPEGYALRLLLAMGALAFHHADLALPAWLDAALARVTPTPRTHRVHHARRLPWTDSNFGTVFTWWDRLFGTWRTREDVACMETGVEDLPRLGARALLRHPFTDDAATWARRAS
jgi:sterol desaturase/sphingolipid hydroxylase (fatty acid hydroxylase superfamily)